LGRLFRGTFKVPSKAISFLVKVDRYIDSKHSIRVVLEGWSLFRVQSTPKAPAVTLGILGHIGAYWGILGHSLGQSRADARAVEGNRGHVLGQSRADARAVEGRC